VADLARSVLAVDLPQERALRIARAYQDARARKGLSRDWGEVRDRLLALSGPELTKVLAIQQ
jgi:hypothetical protein